MMSRAHCCYSNGSNRFRGGSEDDFIVYETEIVHNILGFFTLQCEVLLKDLSDVGRGLHDDASLQGCGWMIPGGPMHTHVSVTFMETLPVEIPCGNTK